jgi:asparagine synthase (glutamine-hydrolysing)
LDRLLSNAVKIRTISDVPLGVFLSGGIDSSLITALMQAQHSGSVRTFSVGVDDDALDESGYAQQVAAHLGTEHSVLRVTAAEAMAVLPELAHIYDEPFSDSSQIPTLLISRFARQSVTVALSGDGGDEIFGGYNRHVWIPRLWNRIGWLPNIARKAIAEGICAISPRTWDHFYEIVSSLLPAKRQFATPGYKLHKFASVVLQNSPRQMYARLLAHWADADQVVIGAHTGIDGGERADDLAIEHLMMLLDAQHYLHDDILVKVDRASMSASLETRAPYLDPRVAAFAWRLPLNWKIQNGVGKWILRKVLYRYVPGELIDRPKRGFGIPLDQWLRRELRDWAESLLEPSRLRQEGYLDPAPIRAKWDEHLSGRRNWAFELWDVLMFQAWLENSRNLVNSSQHQLVS